MTRQETYQAYQTAAARRRSRQLSQASTRGTMSPVDGGGRRKVAGAFEWIGDKLGTPAPDAFDDSAFQTGLAADFPTVPGEEERNPELHKIRASYNPKRDSEGNVTPLRRRAGSFAGSVTSGPGVDGALSRASAEGEEVAAAAHATDTMAGPSTGPGDRPRSRRATLEVPKPVYHSPAPRRESSFTPTRTPDSIILNDVDRNPSSPSIVVFPGVDP